jgi:hypothetical protein
VLKIKKDALGYFTSESGEVVLDKAFEMKIDIPN